MFPSFIMAGLIVLLALNPQQGDITPPKGTARPAPDVAVQLRAEAARLKSGPASDFFAALIRAAQPGSREGLTGEEPELIKQADQATREILRFWLDRAL